MTTPLFGLYEIFKKTELILEKIFFKNSGIVIIDLKSIRSIKMLYPDEIVCHNAFLSNGFESHVYHLQYDGEVRFSWDHDGTLLSLSASQVGMKISGNGNLSYFAQRPEIIYPESK